VTQAPAEVERLVPMPVVLPKLPPATQLAEYLLKIDERKVYANGGPFSKRLQSELSRHLACAEDTLVTASSGTAGITAALLSLGLPDDAICLMPSWTSASTPHAAMAAGLKPWFLDVDRRTWALDPNAVKQMLSQNDCAARAIIVVSPFGAPIDMTAWQLFQEETGLSVIVDATAGFDTVRSSSLISVVSMNANRILSAGEGDFVVAPNAAVRDRIKACSHSGHDGNRPVETRAICSNLSEYHAAIALANLDNWPATRLRHLQIAGWYRQAFANLPQVCLQPGYGEGWVGGTTNILLESDSAESISRYMRREGIETRLWWGAGCHAQPAFARCQRGDLAKTDYLGARVLGLPHFTEMEKDDVTSVVRMLSKALTSRARGRRRPS